MKKGFTLIEVLIALAILSTLVILVATSIQMGVKNKTKIQEQLDDVSQIRNALKVMENDINRAFHYQDLEKEFLDEIKKANQPAQPTPPPNPFGQPTPPQAPNTQASPNAVPPEVQRVAPTTHFLGEDVKMNFVTKNVQRTVADSRIADYQEVGYELKECGNISGQGQSGKCIWRRSSPYVDREQDKGGEEMVLLDNITEFNLRYFGKGKQDWVNQWKTTTQGGDAVTTGNFPLAVEISLTYEREVAPGREKKYSMQLVVPIRFPNNKPK